MFQNIFALDLFPYGVHDQVNVFMIRFSAELVAIVHKELTFFVGLLVSQYYFSLRCTKGSRNNTVQVVFMTRFEELLRKSTILSLGNSRGYVSIPRSRSVRSMSNI